ncbi:YigZ family protein [Sutcliffiella horikoshii]|uniref:YigZ family protein n=1 Tax=Sutcliffiella horikoshii TaxID=79883 RepID=UPI001F2AC263|nr:YigZ family protein [Sutcliffiella horikoshii]
MLSHYYTVKGHGEHEITIQKSRFIAHIARATTEEEAQNFIQEIKKKHWGATHNCSAYMIGEHDQVQKANDDGEPSGTAGVPILEVLKKKGLKDTVVVITRYFGGIKLGAGGLIRAYGKATSEGISATGMVERKLVQIMHITVDYTLSGKVEYALHTSSYEIKQILYLDTVTFEIYVTAMETPLFKNWITELTNGKGEITSGVSIYKEKSVIF